MKDNVIRHFFGQDIRLCKNTSKQLRLLNLVEIRLDILSTPGFPYVTLTIHYTKTFHLTLQNQLVKHNKFKRQSQLAHLSLCLY